jgi:hypothetical protein
MLLRVLPGVSNNRCCTDDEQPPEIAISLLADAAEPLLAARRVLPRDKSDPCCKIPTGFEITRVCDSGSDGRGPDHAYPRHGLEAAGVHGIAGDTVLLGDDIARHASDVRSLNQRAIWMLADGAGTMPDLVGALARQIQIDIQKSIMLPNTIKWLRKQLMFL